MTITTFTLALHAAALHVLSGLRTLLSCRCHDAQERQGEAYTFIIVASTPTAASGR